MTYSMSQPSTNQDATSTIINGLRDGCDMASHIFSKTFDHPMKGVHICETDTGTTLTWVRIATVEPRHNKWDTQRREQGSVIVPAHHAGNKGPAILKTRVKKEDSRQFDVRIARTETEDKCRHAFEEGAKQLPEHLRQYHSELCASESDPQRRESYDLIGHICEEAKQGSGTGHGGVVQWFNKANMLKATSRLFERKLIQSHNTEFNLHDHIAKFEAAKILIEHEWWPYAMIDSSVAPSKGSRPNDLSICVRNTEADLVQACDVCNGSRRKSCKMCRTLTHQRWFDVELKAGMADLGHHEYGRLMKVFSLHPGNQAHATTTIILWYKQTGIADTPTKLINRFADPQAMLTTSTISRVALNATISYSRRNFITTTSIKKAFEEAGIEVDMRSEKMTDDAFAHRLSLPYPYSYVVRMIPSCMAGELNSVLQDLGSLSSSESRGAGGAAKRSRLAIHQEPSLIYLRQDHTAAFQSGTSSQMNPDRIFGLQSDDLV